MNNYLLPKSKMAKAAKRASMRQSLGESKDAVQEVAALLVAADEIAQEVARVKERRLLADYEREAEMLAQKAQEASNLSQSSRLNHLLHIHQNS